MPMFKIALVKEACYQDLWTCDKSEGFKNLLESALKESYIGIVGNIRWRFFYFAN